MNFKTASRSEMEHFVNVENATATKSYKEKLWLNWEMNQPVAKPTAKEVAASKAKDAAEAKRAAAYIKANARHPGRANKAARDSYAAELIAAR